MPDLILDPGHGGKDGGGGSCEKWTEKQMNLNISLYMYNRFKELGISVALTREDDTFLSPEKRTGIVKSSGAKYCISNHINAGGGKGCETIHSIYSNGKLAKMTFEELKKTGINGRRVFTRTLENNYKVDYYFMIRDTKPVETIIIEYGFADNKEDVDFITNNYETLAEGAIKAFCDYAGYEYSLPKSKTEDIHNWKEDGLKRLHEQGILEDIDIWLKKLDEPAPIWMVGLLLSRIYDKLKE